MQNDPNIDNDILGLLTDIESGSRTIEKSIELFITSLPGFESRLHSKPTVKKYAYCLQEAPNSFLRFITSRSVCLVEGIRKEDTEIYKMELLNKLDQQTVRPYITAVRLFIQFLHRMGWIKEDWSSELHVPKVKKKEHIKVIPKQVTEEILKNDWGVNSF